MSVILEANQNNADKVFVNGKYNCSFPTGITFNKGDRLTARLCSIDSQKSDTTTIILKDDVVATITYSYYDCDFDQSAAKLNMAGMAGWGTTYDYYSAYTSRKYFQLDTCHATIIVPDMGYPNYNTLTVYMNFTYLNVNGVVSSTSGTTTYNFKGNDHYPGGSDVPINVDCAAPEDIVYIDGTLQCTEINVTIADAFSQQIHFGPTDVDVNFYRPAQNATTQFYPPGEAGTHNLRLGHKSVKIAAGRYDPNEIAQLLTQGLTDPMGIQSVPVNINQVLIPNNSVIINLQQLAASDGTPNDMIFSKIAGIPDLSPASVSAFTWADPVPYYFIGASLMAFQYGITGSIFQWSYGHMAFYNPNGPGIRNAAIYVTGATGTRNLKYILLTTSSGIVIHDMVPVDFWTQLGLYNVDKQPIITPLQTTVDGLQYYNYNDWQSPREGTTIAFFTPSFNRSPVLPTAAAPTYLDTTAVDTDALLGDAITSNVDGGYFLVRAAFNGSTSEYYDNTNIYDNIVSIVSTQYNTANTITGFADSAIVYEHFGAPYIISSVSIDILDPRTKETSSGLGSNNTIIFQIDRAPQNITILDDTGKPQTVQVLN